jgi:hypothetical protein
MIKNMKNTNNKFLRNNQILRHKNFIKSKKRNGIYDELDYLELIDEEEKKYEKFDLEKLVEFFSIIVIMLLIIVYFDTWVFIFRNIFYPPFPPF